MWEIIKGILINLASSSIWEGGDSIRTWKGEKRLKDQLDSRLDSLKNRYQNTVVERDSFQQCFEHQQFMQKVMQYISDPYAVAQTDADLIRQLLDIYAQSPGVVLSSSDKMDIRDFLGDILQFCREYYSEQAGAAGRAVAALTNNSVRQALQGVHREITVLQSTIQSEAASASQSPSAGLFRRKFHKRLFLESQDGSSGAELAQVYIPPHVCCPAAIDDNGFPLIQDAETAVSAFLQSGKFLLMIEGCAGSGKSSLIAFLSERWDSSEYMYLSLKDLVQGKNEIHFFDDVLRACDLKQTDTGRIFILDGYDEIHSRMHQEEFEENLRRFEERGHRIILTTRPGYLHICRSDLPHETWRLELFDAEQIRTWLNRYQRYRSQLSPAVCDAILAAADSTLAKDHAGETVQDSIFQIVRIPIMLYVIACCNIDVHTVSHMGDLYDQVFERLKQDKAGQTAAMIDRHYQIAQKIAYHMDAENLLRVSAQQAEAWCGELFDQTFYSSVYIENSILEGISSMEFVHKSILEFLAARWIYDHLTQGDGIYDLLNQNYLSEEVVGYLQYFYQIAPDSESICAAVSDAFYRMVELGVPQLPVPLTVEAVEMTNSRLFYNFAVLLKEVFGRKTFLDLANPKNYGKQLITVLRAFLFDGYAKPNLARRLLRNEDLTGSFIPTYLDLSGMDLTGLTYSDGYFSWNNFENANLKSARFQQMIIKRCNFRGASFEGAVLDDIHFDLQSLNHMNLSYAALLHTTMPSGKYMKLDACDHGVLSYVTFLQTYLDGVSFDETLMERVDFNKVRFVKCSFRNVQYKNTVFHQCRFRACAFLDDETPTDHTNIDGCIFEECRWEP